MNMLQAPTGSDDAPRGIINNLIIAVPFWVAVVVLYWLFQS